MQFHQLKPKTKKKNRKRIGRGGKRGTYSGRGIKGQKARAGHRIRPELRDVIKKMPKLRGYNMRLTKPRAAAVVNVEDLEKHFGDGAKINPEELAKKNLISRRSGRLPEVKLLGSGQVAKKFLVSHCQFSKSAKEKIEKAGGKIEI